MFVQRTKSTRGDKTYFTYLVRESFRTPKGPRSRTICNITGLPPEVRELVSEALKGKSFVASDEVAILEALDYGGLAVLADAWERFGMDRLLAEVESPRERGLIKAMIFARLLFPCAKLALKEQAEGTMLAAASLFQLLGGEVVGVAAVIDLPELGGSAKLRAAGLAVHTLCEFSETE